MTSVIVDYITSTPYKPPSVLQNLPRTRGTEVPRDPEDRERLIQIISRFFGWPPVCGVSTYVTNNMEYIVTRGVYK